MMLPYNLKTMVLLLGKASLVVLLLLLARVVVWLIKMLLIAPILDPLKNLPGPKASPFMNHFRDIMDPSISPNTHSEWVAKFGKTFRFHGFGRHDYRLMSFDFRVVSHVLSSPVYEKPWQTRTLLCRLLGQGIFGTAGVEHRNQRKLILPAFTTHAVKAMAPIFYQKAEELRDRWDELISLSSSQSTIDVSHWISRAAFDVTGLAAFDYTFHALHDETEEVYIAYRKMFNVADKGPGLKGLVSLFLPCIEWLWPNEGYKTTQRSQRIIRAAGKRLVADKKAAILAEKANDDKDILSLLIKSNLSTDPSKRLSDAELFDQLSTFLFVGSDSTSLAISYCLHHLAQFPDIQTRLRDEIISLREPKLPHSRDSGFVEMLPSSWKPSAKIDSLDALPFLDAVVRETLRLSPPVHGTIREATSDDLIPVSDPVILRDGTVVQKGGFISIRKGSYVHVPIEGLNFSEDVWGKDARIFNPDRWADLPESARSPAHPGLVNLMTFSLGPHSCPGSKFSILEMKVFIATLLPHFVFEEVEGIEIDKFNAIATRPFIKGKFELGAQLPLSVARFGE